MTGAVVTMTIRRSFHDWRSRYNPCPDIIPLLHGLEASLPPRPGAVDGRSDPDLGRQLGLSGRCAHLPFAGRGGMSRRRNHHPDVSSNTQPIRAFSTTQTSCCHGTFSQKLIRGYGNNLSQPFPAETEVGR